MENKEKVYLYGNTMTQNLILTGSMKVKKTQTNLVTQLHS